MNGSVARPGPEIHRPGTLPATGRPFSDGPAPFPAARFRLRQPGSVCGGTPAPLFGSTVSFAAAPWRLLSAARFRFQRLGFACGGTLSRHARHTRHPPRRRHTRSRCKIRVKPGSDTYPDYGRIYPIYGLSTRQTRRPKTASAHPPACAAPRAPRTCIPARRHSAPTPSTSPHAPRQKKRVPHPQETAAPPRETAAPSDPLPGEGCCPISYSCPPDTLRSGDRLRPSAPNRRGNRRAGGRQPRPLTAIMSQSVVLKSSAASSCSSVRCMR